VSDPVIFGRVNGQKTKGTVIKVNQKTAQIRQDEQRGTQKSHPVGKVWRVPIEMIEYDESRKHILPDERMEQPAEVPAEPEPAPRRGLPIGGVGQRNITDDPDLATWKHEVMNGLTKSGFDDWKEEKAEMEFERRS
jgi:hypothetical protein